MKLSASSASLVGAIYTPPEWANWLIDRGEVYEKWLSGSSVCDPTGGKGVFILQLLLRAVKDGADLKAGLISNLGYIEIDPDSCATFLRAAERLIGSYSQYIKIDNVDVILNTPDRQYDILIGNPPWVNFCDLPSEYKEKLKEKFVEQGLVSSSKSVLLGSSRTDLAALVLNVTMGRLLSPSGNAYFFLPTSLYYGDNAHKGWRCFRANGRNFATEWIYEFSETRVFEGIGTSYCAAEFQIDKTQHFPVKCFKEDAASSEWKTKKLGPLRNPDDQWIDIEINFDPASIRVTITKSQMPRQGVNTCGANDLFIFDERPSFVPQILLFPLATKEIFAGIELSPVKWILLPYDREISRPLSWSSIQKFPALAEYLLFNEEKLRSRKGTLIRSSIEKGYWWSLLGVGPYSFAPYKVIWQSYGQKKFAPVMLPPYEGMPWQGNQAMNALIPCWESADANRILSELKNPMIEQALRLMNGEGKCNWAQPGKLKKILSINEPIAIQQSLF
jgi:hypothetical protein